MEIQLQNWKIQNLSFEKLNEVRKENSFGLKTSQGYLEEEEKKFLIIFDIDFKHKDFSLIFQMAFAFTTEEKITNKFKSSDFIKINAPAIAFPFVRSYISNLTLQSGFDPVILPSINFVKLAKED